MSTPEVWDENDAAAYAVSDAIYAVAEAEFAAEADNDAYGEALGEEDDPQAISLIAGADDDESAHGISLVAGADEEEEEDVDEEEEEEEAEADDDSNEEW